MKKTIQIVSRWGSLTRALFAAVAAIPLFNCTGYVPGAQAYWDGRVKELCERDGGVQVLDHIVVTPSEARVLPRVAGYLAVAAEENAKPQEPAFIRIRRTNLHEREPSVVRYEQEVVRRSDQRVVAIAVSYARGGGDLLPIDHPTTYWCPEPVQIYKGIHEVYRIEETSR